MKRVVVLQEAGPFAENQDVARRISESILKDALARGESVNIDFSGVEKVTQPFVHALLSEALRACGEEGLKHINFRGCGPRIQDVIQSVVQSLLTQPSVPIWVRQRPRLGLVARADRRLAWIR